MFLEKSTAVFRRPRFAAESGQTLVEYGLIIGLVAIAAIAGVSLVANEVDSLWGNILDQVGVAIAEVLDL